MKGRVPGRVFSSRSGKITPCLLISDLKSLFHLVLLVLLINVTPLNGLHELTYLNSIRFDENKLKSKLQVSSVVYINPNT